jgi:hypothetical protein
MSYSAPPLRTQIVTYTGDGTASKKIAIGFTPRIIQIDDLSGATALENTYAFDGTRLTIISDSGGYITSVANFQTQPFSTTAFSSGFVDVAQLSTDAKLSTSNAFNLNTHNYVLVVIG